MGVTLIGLVVVIVLGALCLWLILVMGRSLMSRETGASLGHVTLTCPGCQQETRAGQPQCQHCGADL